MHTLLVDGYNVIHGISEFRRLLDDESPKGGSPSPLGKSRQALLEALSKLALAKRGNVQVHVFFDGDPNRDLFDNLEPFYQGVEVHYACSPDADQAILDFLDRIENKAEVTVVTEDKNLARRSSAEGAQILSSGGLAKRLAKI